MRGYGLFKCVVQMHLYQIMYDMWEYFIVKIGILQYF
jgi:hypothetical protein